jgi:hypothetical protein
MLHLTPQETKLIEKLRKQNRQWPRIRWLVLALGVLSTFLFVAYGYFLRLLILESGRQIDSAGVLIFALLWTKCCMYFVFATLSFAIAWRNWRGDVNRMLLLRLLEAQQKETNTDVQTGQ